MKRGPGVTLLVPLLAALVAPAGAQDGDEGGYESAEQVKTSVERILSSVEFLHLHREPAAPTEEESWLEGWLKWFFGNEGESGSAPVDVSSFVVPILYLLVGAVVLLALLWMVRSLVIRASRKAQVLGLVDAPAPGDAPDPALPPGEQAAEAYLERATLLAHEGDYRAAIREILLGCMSWIERQRLLRYRRGLTCRDYLRAVWGSKTRREAFAGIVVNFEEVTFGRRQATAQRFEECVQKFRTAFHQEKTVVDE
jgi:hypothetical protein